MIRIAIHEDRGGALSPPRKSGKDTVYSAICARVHKPGDPLVYESGPEYRDHAELAAIARQLPGKPIRVQHGDRDVGRVISAHVDGDVCVMEFRIDGGENASDLLRKHPEISLQYSASKDSKGYQKGIQVVEASIVTQGRCGPTCASRLDACGCGCASKPDPDPSDVTSRSAKAGVKKSPAPGAAYGENSDDDSDECDPDDPTCEDEDDDEEDPYESSTMDALDLAAATTRLNDRTANAWRTVPAKFQKRSKSAE